MDGQGHTLPYTAQYDESAHTIQTFLPDGSYTLLVTAVGAQSRLSSSDGLRKFRAQVAMLGQVAVSVAGRAVSNLRVPISLSQGNSVQVTVMRTGTQAAHSGVFVTLSQTGGWISDGIVSSYAQGTSAGPLETSYTPPGSYWAHTAIAQKSLCEASFTAGGASLAREPLVVGIAGASATLSLALRDDCASLTLSLPSAVAGQCGRCREVLHRICGARFRFDFRRRASNTSPLDGRQGHSHRIDAGVLSCLRLRQTYRFGVPQSSSACGIGKRGPGRNAVTWREH